MKTPGERLYRALLHLYPERFRDRYGSEMLAFYRERRRAGGRRVWPRILLDLFTTATAERFRALAPSRLVRGLAPPRLRDVASYQIARMTPATTMNTSW